MFFVNHNKIYDVTCFIETSNIINFNMVDDTSMINGKEGTESISFDIVLKNRSK